MILKIREFATFQTIQKNKYGSYISKMKRELFLVKENHVFVSYILNQVMKISLATLRLEKVATKKIADAMKTAKKKTPCFKEAVFC